MFEARPVDSTTLRAAFAVMQLAWPGASLAEFRRGVVSGRFCGKNGIVMALFDRRGYVHAVFRARKEQSSHRRDCLRVTAFTHGDSFSTLMMMEMVEALERFCRNSGCDQMTIEAEPAQAGYSLNLADALSARGISGESMQVSRRF